MECQLRERQPQTQAPMQAFKTAKKPQSSQQLKEFPHNLKQLKTHHYLKTVRTQVHFSTQYERSNIFLTDHGTFVTEH